jgi:hypothetical protein
MKRSSLAPVIAAPVQLAFHGYRARQSPANATTATPLQLISALLLATTVGLLAGCANVKKAATTNQPAASESNEKLSGSVDLDRIAPKPSSRMQLASNQAFIPGQLTAQDAMPEYPSTLLPLRLPDQQVCVSFTSDADGSTSNVTPLYGLPGCPTRVDSVRPEFVAATLDAVSRWGISPARLCTSRPGTPEQHRCVDPDSTVDYVAVTLAYRFLFSAKSGTGTVQTTEVGH